MNKEKIKSNLYIVIIMILEVLVIVIGGNLLLRDMARLELEMREVHGSESSIPAVEIETNDVEEVSQPVDTSYIPEPVAPVQLQEEEYYDSLEELAVCVEAEAGNQSLEGRRMVVAVILNRVDDPGFPDTVKGVIEQKGQFTSFWDGNMAKIKEPSEKSIQAVQLELKERKYKTIFFFRGNHYSKYGSPAWKFEDHYFNSK